MDGAHRAPAVGGVDHRHRKAAQPHIVAGAFAALGDQLAGFVVEETLLDAVRQALGEAFAGGVVEVAGEGGVAARRRDETATVVVSEAQGVAAHAAGRGVAAGIDGARGIARGGQPVAALLIAVVAHGQALGLACSGDRRSCRRQSDSRLALRNERLAKAFMQTSINQLDGLSTCKQLP